MATGALRYFLLKYGRTSIITFDMEEALAFVGETGPYIQNAVVRARNIFAKLEADGHHVAALLERAAGLDLDRSWRARRATRCGRSLLLMARSEEVAEQSVRAEEVVAAGQTRVRGGPGLPLVLPEAALLGALREDDDDCARSAPSSSTPSSARWKRSLACSASPSRSGCDGVPDRGHHRLLKEAARLFVLRDDYVRSVEQAGGLPIVLAPAARRTRAPAELLDRIDGLVLSGGADVDPALYGQAPHPTLARSSRSGTSSSWRFPGRPWPGTCPFSLSAGAIRC